MINQKPSELLKKHFEETPQEELDKEWENIKVLNDIGPDVEEYAKFFKTPEESLGITTEKYNKIVDACIWGGDRTDDYCELGIMQEGGDYVLQFSKNGRNISDFLVSGACMNEIAKKVVKDIISKFILNNPPTEEGLNKTRYRLAYEDGYRSCLKNVRDYLYENLPADYWGNITASPKNFINQLNEEMEEKL